MADALIKLQEKLYHIGNFALINPYVLCFPAIKQLPFPKWSGSCVTFGRVFCNFKTTEVVLLIVNSKELEMNV